MIWQSCLIFSYIGPDQMLPVASMAATIIGGTLMCGRYVLYGVCREPHDFSSVEGNCRRHSAPKRRCAFVAVSDRNAKIDAQSGHVRRI